MLMLFTRTSKLGLSTLLSRLEMSVIYEGCGALVLTVFFKRKGAKPILQATIIVKRDLRCKVIGNHIGQSGWVSHLTEVPRC
jgi:hypothetical protein